MASIEFLKKFLGDELYAQVEAKLKDADGLTLVNTADGSFVPKAKLDTEITKRKKQEDLVKERDNTITDLEGQITTLEGKNGDTAALNKTITELKAQAATHAKELETRDARYAALEQRQDIIAALRNKKAKNPETVYKLLDLSKIEKTEDGKYKGLEEQITERIENEGYLFDNAPGDNGGFAGGADIGGDAINKTVNNAIRAASGRAG